MLEIAPETAGSSGPPPSSQAREVIERPPPGLARGKFAASPWAIGLLGAAIVAIALAYVLWRARRRRT